MKGIEKLQENLKNLPKYSLDEEQKNRIIRALKKETKPRKSVQVMKPFLVFALLCATIFVLALTSDRGSWLHDLKQSFQPQVEFDALEANVFKNDEYDVLGIEGEVGILVFNEQFIAEDARRGSKLMLYFWGDPSELINKKYRVEAMNVYNSTITLSEGILYYPLMGEDAHSLASFPPFPAEGEWQLSFFVEDQLFEKFTIEVLPPLPKTDHYTVIDPPMETYVGKETEVNIESSIGSKKEIEVKLLNGEGIVVSEGRFVRDDDAPGSPQVYHFSGKIMFPEKGIWTLLIDGEKTKSFKN